ncbi:MAG: Rieske (2Fe-2S) protein [Nitrospirae bacterium]|nr:Rieske (2Fe-2S) protein [Nitrospirota bacterium]
MKVKKSEIKDNTMIEVIYEGTPVLIANAGGNYYAVGGVCPHMKCRLQKGTLKGSTVTCPCHGASFDVATGKLVSWVTKMSKDLARFSMYFGWARDLKAYTVRSDGDYLEIS